MKALGIALVVVGALAVVFGVGCWFGGIWTHGHDAATRMSATGFLAVFVGGITGTAGSVLFLNSGGDGQ